MSEGMIIRDPYEMEKFAKELENYCINMRNACNKLTSSLESAAPQMKDTVSQQALLRVHDLATNLLSELPNVEGTANMLVKAAKPLQQAIQIKI